MILRRAEQKDCKDLLELIHELALFEKAPEQVTVTLDHFERSGFGENPVWWAWVAEVEAPDENKETEIIGFALYYVRYSTWKGQRMYLEDFYVKEKWRQKGAGKLLFEKMIQEGKEKKFAGMLWQVLSWNEPAIRFYEKYNAHFDKGWINCSIEF